MSNKDLSFGFYDAEEGARRDTGILCGLLNVWREVFKRSDKVNASATYGEFHVDDLDESLSLPYFRIDKKL